jgi:transposase InsO family protein
MSGQEVAEALHRAIARCGQPRSNTVDHGTDFTSRALDEWAYRRRGVLLDFTRPGRPTDNGHIESFNGKLRDEMFERQSVLVDRGCAGQNRGVADGLQSSQIAQHSWEQEPGGVLGKVISGDDRAAFFPKNRDSGHFNRGL